MSGGRQPGSKAKRNLRPTEVRVGCTALAARLWPAPCPGCASVGRVTLWLAQCLHASQKEVRDGRALEVVSPDHQTPMNANERPPARHARRYARIDHALLDWLMTTVDIQNCNVARATDFSAAYVSEVRHGKRERVAALFLHRLRGYLGPVVGPGFVNKLIIEWLE